MTTHYLLERFSNGKDSTLGLLFRQGEREQFLAFTLEDEKRTEKVYGETRIPEGIYRVKLKTEGGFHERYSRKFDFHEGMLHLQDVQNFTDILIHIGNDDDDTAGCILTGDTCTQNVTKEGFIGASTDAYKRVYLQMLEDLRAGEVYIEVRERLQ